MGVKGVVGVLLTHTLDRSDSTYFATYFRGLCRLFSMRAHFRDVSNCRLLFPVSHSAFFFFFFKVGVLVTTEWFVTVPFYAVAIKPDGAEK